MSAESDSLSVDVGLTVGPLSIDLKLEIGVRGLVLIGPNGAGKTSALHAILGLRRPERGRVTAGGRVLFDGSTGRSLPPEERGLGYVPQDYALFPHLSAARNVEFALACVRPPAPQAERERVARRMLSDVGVTDAAEQMPDALSGGARQRVALARALAIHPTALLLDEPFAALDVETRSDVRGFVIGQLRALALPFLVVTHDAADAAAIAAPVAVMEEGRIVQTGELADLRRAPATAYVARFAG